MVTNRKVYIFANPVKYGIIGSVKMGKWLDIVNEHTQRYKPIVERRLWLKLEDITVEPWSKLEDINVELNSGKLAAWKNRIFVNEEYFDKLLAKAKNKRLQELFMNLDMRVYVLHELIHLAHYSLLYNKVKELKTKKQDLRRIDRCENLISMEYDNWLRTFLEGFAVYGCDIIRPIAYTHLRDIFRQYKEPVNDSREFILRDQLDETWKEYKCKDNIDSELGYNPYERGYEFFRNVIPFIFGRKDKLKLFDIATNPPINEDEMLNPASYLMRINNLARGT